MGTEIQTRTDLALQLYRADFTVKNYTMAAAALGLIPGIITTFVLLAGIQVLMLRSLCKLYGVEFTEELARLTIAALIGSIVPVSLSLNVAGYISQQQALPLLLRNVLTTFVSPVFGAAVTYAIGKVFIQHFEAGGTLLTFDTDLVREYYQEQIKQGQTLVQATIANKKP